MSDSGFTIYVRGGSPACLRGDDAGYTQDDDTAVSYPFSALALRIISLLKLDVDVVDVLADSQEEARAIYASGTKLFPQIFLDGRYLGGGELLFELARSGAIRRIGDDEAEPFSDVGTASVRVSEDYFVDALADGSLVLRELANGGRGDGSTALQGSRVPGPGTAWGVGDGDSGNNASALQGLVADGGREVCRAQTGIPGVVTAMCAFGDTLALVASNGVVQLRSVTTLAKIGTSVELAAPMATLSMKQPGSFEFWSRRGHLAHIDVNGRGLWHQSGNLGSVWALATIPDQPNCLFSGAADGSVRAWDLQALDRPPQLVTKHDGWVTVVGVDEAGNCWSTSSDGTLRVRPGVGLGVSVSESRIVAADLGWVNAMAIGRSVLITGGATGRVRAWELATGRSLAVAEPLPGWINQLGIGKDISKDMVVAATSHGALALLRLPELAIVDVCELTATPTVLCWVGADDFMVANQLGELSYWRCGRLGLQKLASRNIGIGRVWALAVDSSRGFLIAIAIDGSLLRLSLPELCPLDETGAIRFRPEATVCRFGGPTGDSLLVGFRDGTISRFD